MFQPIPAFDLQQFNKIPIHRHIFTPFTQTSSSVPKRKHRQLQGLDAEEQMFENLKIVFDEDLSSQIYDDSQLPGHRERRGKIQYVYGWNQCCLDAVDCQKSTKYRFLLSTQPKQRTLAQIKRKLLVIINETNIYIHDLIRHNNRTITNSIQLNLLSQSWLLSLSRNQHFIYTASPLPTKTLPTLELRLFSINMANNFDVQLKSTKFLVFCEQPSRIVQAIVREHENQIGVCAIVEDQQGKRIFFAKLKKKHSNLSQPWVVEMETKLELQFTIWQADSYLVNQSMLTSQQRYSRIRSSWYQEERGSSIRVKSGEKEEENNFKCEWTENYSLVYKKNSPEIMVVENCVLPTTKLIQHDGNIIDIVYCGQERVYLLDESGCIWEYDFEQYQEDILPFNSSLALDMKNALNSINSQTQRDAFGSRIKIISSHGGRLGIVLDGKYGYVSYPLFLRPSQLGSPSGWPNSTQTFLSVQSEHFQDHSLLTSQRKQYFLMPNLSPFISYSTLKLKVNILQKIVLEALPLIKANLLFSCSCFLKLEVTSILEYILSSLEGLKDVALGSLYDCQENSFYWILADLWFRNNRHHTNDMKEVLNILISEQKEAAKVLEVILNECQLKAWLLEKCEQKLYAMPCTTNYLKCELITGCSCLFKRLLRFFISRSSYLIKGAFSHKIDFLKTYKLKDYIVHLLKAGESSKLQLLTDSEQQKIICKMLKKPNQTIFKADPYWDQQFKVTTQESSPPFVFDKPFGTNQNFQINLSGIEQKQVDRGE